MKTRLVHRDDRWELLADGRPLFIRGAVGRSRFDRLAQLGANAVRIPASQGERLESAHAAGLAVLANLPLRPERDGMDYGDRDAVQEQHTRILEMVADRKDEPAIFAWCIGNELDHIPARNAAGSRPYDVRVWDAVNAIAEAIHEIDPDHPTLTAVGMGRFGKIQDCAARCPALDLIGINAYADIDQAAALLAENGWTKPYLFTEWGMSGPWQRPRTTWQAPFEESSTIKADCYRRRYSSAIAGHPGRCLGGFAFYWGWRHETTLSWFNTWDPDGNEMETVEVWKELWTGVPADPELPHLYGVRVSHRAAPDNVILQPGESVPFEALIDQTAQLPGMRFHWELRPEVEYGAYAGSGESLPDVVAGAIESNDGVSGTLRAPDTKGRYRLFAYLYDQQNRFATANLPVHVGEPGSP